MKEATDEEAASIMLAEFQSTLPMKEATRTTYQPITQFDLFQSTLPMKEATFAKFNRDGSLLFQSTLPMKEATVSAHIGARNKGFNPRFQ